MTIRELIEHLKTLDQNRNIYLQYDTFLWYEMYPEYIEKVGESVEYSDLNGVSPDDYKIEMG